MLDFPGATKRALIASHHEIAPQFTSFSSTYENESLIPTHPPATMKPLREVNMLVSDAKIDANRQNAQHSTGPVTPEGKKRSSLNATRHGLTGQVIITTEEDKKAYDAHCASFHYDWQPQGATEKHLVQTIAAKQWQMHHADSM